MSYPMKMLPAFKDYLWGGERLATEYGKNTSANPLAESWEVSCHPDGLSIIENGVYAGKSLAEVLAASPSYLGSYSKDTGKFPILIKIIDAKQSLSLQVHPTDQDSQRLEGLIEGKNEMWYILDAKPGAKLIMGFHKPLSKEEMHSHISDNTILEAVREVPVKTGDCFPIPAGMLHAIGEGIFLAEVQQSSNITYRVYDFDRRDKEGNARELHVDKAVEVLDSSLQATNVGKNAITQREGYKERLLLSWEWFSTSLLEIDMAANLHCGTASFAALLCVGGDLQVRSNATKIRLQTGESVFIPANLGAYSIDGAGKILYTTVPPKK